jgi:hypothetical protein
MSSTMMMDRASVGMPGLGVPGMGTGQVGSPTGMPSTMMVPRCTFKVEKVQGGFKLWCHCDDKMSCSMVQNLCTMLAGGMCSCSVMWNGMTICCYNLTMGLCKYDMTEDGVCVTCTSGDQSCGQMIQACCDCLSTMLQAGCTCCFLMNNTPVCCGTYAASGAGAKAKAGK